VLLAVAAAQAIAVIYDFYKIPGNEEQMIFYTLATAAWAFLCVALYHAYCALERADGMQTKLLRVRTLQEMECRP
jgi:hypothetical protein